MKEFNYKGAAQLAVCEFLGNDINGNGRYRVVIIIDNKAYTASGKVIIVALKHLTAIAFVM